MHHSSIREHLAKIHPECIHNSNSPGYVYNASAVPDPEHFNSTTFDKQAFIAEAKQNNDKLSAHITSSIQGCTPPTPNQTSLNQQNGFNIIDTPVSISPSSSNNDNQYEPEITIKRRRKVTAKRLKNDSVLDGSYKYETPKNSNPFSIDSIMSTPVIPKCEPVPQIGASPIFYNQFNAAAWIYANQMFYKMMTNYATNVQRTTENN
jgi:hypothetical protein